MTLNDDPHLAHGVRRCQYESASDKDDLSVGARWLARKSAEPVARRRPSSSSHTPGL